MRLSRLLGLLFVGVFLTAPLAAAAAPPAPSRDDAPEPRKANPPAKEEPRDASAKSARDGTHANGSNDDAKARDIRRLLKATGAGELGVQAFKQVQAQFKQTFPEVPQSFWSELEKEVKADDLVEMVLPIYAKYLTHQDVKELIKFYESPVGRKLVKAQPRIMAESMQAGQQWGAAIAEKVKRRLKSEGYISA